jgi:hypothetical protein
MHEIFVRIWVANRVRNSVPLNVDTYKIWSLINHTDLSVVSARIKSQNAIIHAYYKRPMEISGYPQNMLDYLNAKDASISLSKF